ncbi:MAG: hypothetical protein HW378_188 [Anaerolineales bacterium]|nr:hypothetical protein [Anaerolineales bacterium]
MRHSLLVLSLLALTAGLAQAQNLITQSLISGNLTVTNGQTLTVNGPALPLRSGRGVGFVPAFSTTEADTSTITWKFDVSLDGSNWSTTQPLSGTSTLNGTNVVRAYLLFKPIDVDGVKELRLARVINGGTNTVTVTAATAGILIP